MPGRSITDESYRYGFQGQEMDDEVKGAGNSVNYKYRMHDPRLGRFFATDPLTAKYPWYSPYQFSGNKVIAFVELEGLEEGNPGEWNELTGYSMQQDNARVADVIDWNIEIQDQVHNQAIFIFYHGGAGGDGQVQEWHSFENIGYTREFVNYVKKQGLEAGIKAKYAVIAPSATQFPGVETGKRILEEHYVEGDLVFIFGYSYGGDNAVNLAEVAEDLGIPVHTLVIVDSSDGPLHQITVDSSIPENTNYALVIYQTQASGTSLKTGTSDADADNSSEYNYFDGTSNIPGSRGYAHSAEGDNKVINVDASGPKVTHGNILSVEADRIKESIQKVIDDTPAKN